MSLDENAGRSFYDQILPKLARRRISGHPRPSLKGVGFPTRMIMMHHCYMPFSFAEKGVNALTIESRSCTLEPNVKEKGLSSLYAFLGSLSSLGK